MKIVSFIPSATEIVCALGRESDLLGVSHECDFPDGIRDRAEVLVSSPAASASRSQAEIDADVRRILEERGTLYIVDEKKLSAIAPDVIVTQELCQVCAPSGDEVSRAIRGWEPPPKVLYLTPSTFEDVFGTIEEVGRAIGAEEKSADLVKNCRARVSAVRKKAASLKPKTCLFLEWTDPVFFGGHWVNEGIGIAGGRDLLGPTGDSVQSTWDAVIQADPEVLFIGPCGYHLEKAFSEAPSLRKRRGWGDLKAVRSGQVYVVDADSYFARPGPRIVNGLELLAHLLHPDVFDAPKGRDTFRRLPKK